jgi:hypothetical protein
MFNDQKTHAKQAVLKYKNSRAFLNHDSAEHQNAKILLFIYIKWTM